MLLNKDIDNLNKKGNYSAIFLIYIQLNEKNIPLGDWGRSTKWAHPPTPSPIKLGRKERGRKNRIVKQSFPAKRGRKI